MYVVKFIRTTLLDKQDFTSVLLQKYKRRNLSQIMAYRYFHVTITVNSLFDSHDIHDKMMCSFQELFCQLKGDGHAMYLNYRIRGNFRGFKFSRFWVKNMHTNFRGF